MAAQRCSHICHPASVAIYDSVGQLVNNYELSGNKYDHVGRSGNEYDSVGRSGNVNDDGVGVPLIGQKPALLLSVSQRTMRRWWAMKDLDVQRSLESMAD